MTKKAQFFTMLLAGTFITSSAMADIYSDIPQTEFGSGNETKYFEWTPPFEGSEDLFGFGVEVDAPTSGKTTVTAKYSEPTEIQRLYIDSAGDINGNFVDIISEQYSYYYGGAFYGGAIYNENAYGNNIKGTFIGNMAVPHQQGPASLDENSLAGVSIKEMSYDYDYDSSWGGAIANGRADAVLGDVEGTFIGNVAYAQVTAGGGAISNSGQMGDIKGDFIGNTAEGGEAVFGGAIVTSAFLTDYYNPTASSGTISGNFYGNTAFSPYGMAFGGAITAGSYKEINIENSNFYNNTVAGGYWTQGGAIYAYRLSETDGSSLPVVVKNSNFYNNAAIGSSDGYAIAGGAISTDSELTVINSNFYNNYVMSSGPGSNAMPMGGAIGLLYGDKINIYADGSDSVFSGNYMSINGEKIDNAIFTMGDVNLNVKNGGKIVFDDSVLALNMDNMYNSGNTNVVPNLNISGDKCPNCLVNSVIFNSGVLVQGNVTLDTTQMVLGKNAIVAAMGNYEAVNNPILRVELDASTGETGKLIAGDIIGTTKVIVDTKNYKDIRGQDSIVFAAASSASGEANEKSFEIFRVIGSPYKYKIDYQENVEVDLSETWLGKLTQSGAATLNSSTGNEMAKVWGVSMTDEENTYTEDCDPKEDTPSDSKPLGPIEVEPEIVAMEALPSAAIAQTNGMIYNIMRKVNVNRLYCPGCGFYDYNWNGEAFHNLWVDTTYNGLEIDAPVEIEAKVWGIEAGSDIQRDLHNKLGIFVSYRQGNYEMDGKGDKYFAKLGSELDIDSYLAGLYYRYDNNNWYAFATLYGGMQEAEINTDDGVSTDTDGIEFGGSAEVGYSYALNKTVYVTPSLGVFYTQVSYDDASDNYGKTVEYNDLKQVELEAGLKLSKAVYTDNGAASIYVKPSVVQTLVDGDEVTITEIGKVDTIDDETLGRIEIGGNYGFNDNWSAYGWANYTFGSDYEATSVGAGVNYAW